MIRLPMKPVTKVVFLFVLVLLILTWLYIILDIFIPDADRCSGEICTVGYPCFDQGNCGSP